MKIWVRAIQQFPGGRCGYDFKVLMDAETAWDGEGSYAQFEPSMRTYTEGNLTKDDLLTRLRQYRDDIDHIIEEVKNE